MAKMRLVVPNELDITKLSPTSSSAIAAIKVGVSQAKTAVELAKRSLESKRAKRINALIGKTALSDPFAKAQLSLILQTKSVALKTVIGTLNSPINPDTYTSETRSAIESGNITR